MTYEQDVDHFRKRCDIETCPSDEHVAEAKKPEDILNITGDEYLVYVLWGEHPEDPEYITYGFGTEKEQTAFIKGIDEGEGWMGYWAGCGHKADEKALKDFESDIRDQHPDLFNEEVS